MIINGFGLYYHFYPEPGMSAVYEGKPLQQLVIQPTYAVEPLEPSKSKFWYTESLHELADKVFCTIQMLYAKEEHCVAAMLASHFYESFSTLDIKFKIEGKHVLSVPLWKSVLKLVQDWKEKHAGSTIHVGTPLYFLSAAYYLADNIDQAFIYLIKSIDDDIELLSELCPEVHYPEEEPAYITVCLKDHPKNYMRNFVVLPIRKQLQDSIKTYNDLFLHESRLTSITEFDQKFLQKRDTETVKIELIKQLFVLEMIKLLQLRKIENQFNSRFLRMLLLNRLFSLALVVDKLLYATYPPVSTKENEKKDPNMYDCVISYAEKHEMKKQDIDNLDYDRDNPEVGLQFLLEKRTQGKFENVTREIFPILIARLIRNTSAHKIHSIDLLYSKFKEIFQSLMESVFIIAGQIRD